MGGTCSSDIPSFTLSCGSSAQGRKPRILSAWPSGPHGAEALLVASHTSLDWHVKHSSLDIPCSLLPLSHRIHPAASSPQPFTEAAPALSSGPTSGFRPGPQPKDPHAPHQDSIPQLPASEEKTEARRGWANLSESLPAYSILWPRGGAPQPLGPFRAIQLDTQSHWSSRHRRPPQEAAGREAGLGSGRNASLRGLRCGPRADSS